MIGAKRKIVSQKEATRIIWLVVYSDLITNLLLFAMILYATTRLSRQQVTQLARSVERAFASPSELEAARRREESRLQAVRTLLDSYRDLRAAGVTFSFGRDEIALNLPAGPLFDPGEALPQPGLWPLVSRIAPALRQYPYPVTVEGHTDDQPPPPGSPFPSNWELSYARARSVRDYLIESWKLEPGRVAAVGRASSRPLVPGPGPEDRPRNRRITVVLRPPAAWP